MAGRGRVGLTGMAAATAIVSIAYSLGLGRYWIAVVAVIASALCFNWSSGKLDPGKLLSIGRFLAKHVFKAFRVRPKGAAGWGARASTRSGGSLAQVDHQTRWVWGKVVSESSGSSVGGVTLVEIARVGAMLNLMPRPRLTPRQSAVLAESADQVGFAIEPDARADNSTYAWTQSVAVYRTTPGSGPPVDPRYLGASRIFRLGLYVAAADGSIDPREVDSLATFLETHFKLGPAEVRRIEALKVLLTAFPPSSLAGLGKVLQARLSASVREQVGQILVGVAGVDGSISRPEVTALRLAYRSLGIDSSTLDGLIHRLQPPPAPRTTQVATPTTTPTPAPVEESVAIDPVRLQKVLGETRDVARILGEAMKDAEDDVEPEVKPAPVVVTHTPTSLDPRFEGLDTRYQPMLTELLTKPQWSHEEFEAMARRHALMPSSASEVINEWSQDRFGDLILEPIADDGLRVQTPLLPPLTVPHP